MVPDFAVLGHVAPGLAHKPDGSVLGGFAPARAEHRMVPQRGTRCLADFQLPRGLRYFDPRSRVPVFGHEVRAGGRFLDQMPELGMRRLKINPNASRPKIRRANRSD